MEIQELCKLGFRCVLSSDSGDTGTLQTRVQVWCGDTGTLVHCRDTGTLQRFRCVEILQTRVQVCIVSEIQLCKLGSGVYCRVVSGDTGTLQTRVQVCIVE